MLTAKDFRSNAYAKLQGKWLMFTLAVIIESALVSAVSSLTFGILTLVVTAPMTLGLTYVTLDVSRGRDVSFERLFKGFANFVSAFVLLLVNTIFIALWSLLFIIPGIVKSYAYSLSFYLLADNPDLSFTSARVQSEELMRGNKWRMFCLDCSFIGWYILGCLTFGLLLLFVVPYHTLARAEFYASLVAEREAPAAKPADIPASGSAFGTGYGESRADVPPADPFEEYKPEVEPQPDDPFADDTVDSEGKFKD